MLWLLLLLAGVVVDAVAQGRLNLIMRRYVPPSEQANVNIPLHYLYPWLYALLVVAVGVELTEAGPTIHLDRWAVAVLLRVALFDPVLNKVKGGSLFAVGTSAHLDQLLRRITPGSQGRNASAALRVLALLGVGLLLFLRTP